VYVVQSYSQAVVFCVVTMLCWGSWANTRRVAPRDWRFELYYWDYVAGVLLLTLLLGTTLGSSGHEGRPFAADLAQASHASIVRALVGGAIFNLANILLVAAIEIAGMAVAFPVGIGLALIVGVVVNYLAAPVGNGTLLLLGVALIALAITMDALAYRRLSVATDQISAKGLLLSVASGVFMGMFYRFVAASMYADPARPEIGLMGAYAAVFVFAIGMFLSSFLWNTLAMRKPFVGPPVSVADYFRASPATHLSGLLGGAIWALGMSFSLIASARAGFAISYGLGQGATMIAALWGVFVWREFRKAPARTGRLLAGMFICFLGGLALIVVARTT
jgi:glucose uptake protein